MSDEDAPSTPDPQPADSIPGPVDPETEVATEPSAFRWRLDHRPDLRFGHAAGGVAGVLVAFAIFAFVSAVADDDPTYPGVGFNVLLIALAIVIGFRIRGPVRAAAVAAIVIAVPQVWLFAVVGDGESFGRGDVRLVLLLTIAAYAALYVVSWTRGHAIFLGLALLVAANWLVTEVANPFSGGGIVATPSGSPFNGASPFGSPTEKLGETAALMIVIAVALLGTAIVLDRRGHRGAATPPLFVGVIYAVQGAIVLGVDVKDAYATGIFLAVAGIAIGLAGTLGRRRGTSWIGALVVLAGALTLVGKGADATASGDASAATFGAFALIAAAVLLAVGCLVAYKFDEPIDGGEPPIPRNEVESVTPAV